MKYASQKVILQRLQEVWDDPMDEHFDEVEVEKEWWLYMAWEKLRKKSEPNPESSLVIEERSSLELGVGAQNLLLLYHTQRKLSMFQLVKGELCTQRNADRYFN